MQVDSESWSLKVSVMPGRKLMSGFLAAVALFCSLLPGLQAAEASASEVVTVAVSDTLLDAEAHEGAFSPAAAAGLVGERRADSGRRHRHRH